MYNNEQVTFNMATMPARVEALQDTVLTILPQCDLLNIYLNNFDEVPAFLVHPKIKTFLGKKHKGDLGDVGKFYKVANQKGYIFTVDDKILYPPDYVRKMVQTIERTGRKAAVSNHGHNFHTNRPSSSYYFDIAKAFHYQSASELTFVHNVGTGVLAFHSDTLMLDLSWFPHSNMTDIYFSLECQKRNIPLVIHPHAKGWLKLGTKHDENFSIHAFCNRKDGFQTKVINAFSWKIISCKVEPLFPVRIGFEESLEVRIGELNCSVFSPELAVIVPVFNNLEFTRKLIEGLKQNTFSPYTLIIIDDASTDGTIEYISKLKATVPLIYYYNEVNRGVNYSWNKGIRIARSIGADYMAILNNDLELAPKWDLPLKNKLDDENIGIVSPYSTYGNQLHRRFPLVGSVNPLGLEILGCCFMFRSSLIDRIGYVPEDLRHYYGDNWFQDITKEAGMQVVYAPESRVHHYYQQTTSKTRQNEIVTHDKKAYETILMDGMEQHIHFKA